MKGMFIKPVTDEGVKNIKKLAPIVKKTFDEYSLAREGLMSDWSPQRSFSWLEERFHARTLTDEQLNELWFAFEEFFRDLRLYRDENNEMQWRRLPVEDLEFYQNADSAWKGYINLEVENRRK